MKNRMATLGLISVMGLGACATAPTGPVKALPPEFIDAAMEAAMAETIADECGSLRYNTQVEERVLTTFAVRLVAAGYTERDLRHGSKQLERDPANYRKAVKMITDRNIDVSKEASWCAAGNREISRGTSIGRFLIRG
jgi:hypothetical protein